MSEPSSVSEDDRLQVADLAAQIDRDIPERPFVDLYSLGDQMTLDLEEAQGLRDWLIKVLP